MKCELESVIETLFVLVKWEESSISLTAWKLLDGLVEHK